MNRERCLVLDANILMRGALGSRILPLLRRYETDVMFLTPELCFSDARYHVLDVKTRRGLNPVSALSLLDEIETRVHSVTAAAYVQLESVARPRISPRDNADWPIIATALLLNAPIWTEDQDFFGCGIATWTSDKVEIYLSDAQPAAA